MELYTKEPINAPHMPSCVPLTSIVIQPVAKLVVLEPADVDYDKATLPYREGYSGQIGADHVRAISVAGQGTIKEAEPWKLYGSLGKFRTAPA
ncbi:Digeranylgeranylglyceryl phosphate synthase [Trichinella spiralis]|uniref:Digeranylgeranylglyceryl phosphate synthase n=1 Tax=Trichinella spiralis TaxID=6334 RepID=A0ABR3L1F0_TRISP